MNGAKRQGAIYIFDYDLSFGNWQQSAKLVANDSAANDMFGKALSWIDNDTILVGAPQANVGANVNAEAVYRFEKQGQSWQQTQKIVPQNAEAQRLFGWSLACCYSDMTASPPKE